jgi:hypothetical protein
MVAFRVILHTRTGGFFNLMKAVVGDMELFFYVGISQRVSNAASLVSHRRCLINQKMWLDGKGGGRRARMGFVLKDVVG